METSYFVITVLILVVIFLIWRDKNNTKTFKNSYKSARERIDRLDKDLKSNEESLKIYKKYFSLFHTYYNEDWNRDTPFLKIIEIGRIFIFTNGGSPKPPHNLETPISEIEIPLKSKQRLQEEFGKYWNHVSQFPLGAFLMLMADLKSFKIGSSENGSRTATEFLEWRIRYNQ
ncbi:hypothetical protein LPB90_18415 [Chryseobacterium sp. LC2016-29]|uniref:hypothetical protein n=1 Tax=Chryseobacterium sp. LC2016-29 TaxID=2897331 RepID=UPI001E4CC0E5|nr:hypothetical protein [Chryseobacterium sp. LC2016-29]MCD0480417.1 hypothetical protein [Chryseobacterium sp. LC2016-29]